MKKILIFLSLAVLAYFAYVRFLRPTPRPSPDQADMVIFWGIGCPHCETVKDYLKNNKADSLLDISLLEVFYNKNNQKIFHQIVQKCPEINPDSLAVPLAYAQDRCYQGSDEIIRYLDNRIRSSP